METPRNRRWNKNKSIRWNAAISILLDWFELRLFLSGLLSPNGTEFNQNEIKKYLNVVATRRETNKRFRQATNRKSMHSTSLRTHKDYWYRKYKHFVSYNVKRLQNMDSHLLSIHAHAHVHIRAVPRRKNKTIVKLCITCSQYDWPVTSK